jgi:FkbM family methyltransferase
MDWIDATSSVLGVLPPGSGQRKLADGIHRRWLSQNRDARQVRLAGGANVELKVGDWVQGTTLLTRRYEPELLSFVTRRLAGGGTMIDAGAHIGIVSLTAAQNPRVKVHAFEPDPANVVAFRRNLALNPDARVELNEVAVGEEAGEVHLSVPIPGQSSIGHISDEGVPVRQVTLDEYADEHGIERVDLLKMDVEGYECSVLRGARRLLEERRIGVIVTEVHEAFLQRAGASRTELESLLAGYAPRPLPPVGLHRIRPAEKIDYDNVVFERV